MAVGLGWLTAVLASVCLVCFAPSGRAAPLPTFSLIDGDIAIDPGATDGSASMVLKADNLDADGMTKTPGPVSDLKTPKPPEVAVNFTANELDHGDGSRRWVLTADIKGLPRNVMQKRYLSFVFGDQHVILPYTVSNKSTATFTWSVKAPPSELSLKAGQAIEIGIAVQAVAATKVGVLQTTLVEQSRKTPLDGGLTLCTQPVAPCTESGISLAPNSANRLWLQTNKDSTIVGKYAGTVTVSAAEKPDGETLTLTIYGTTVYRQRLGVLIIIIGVAIAWLITTWAQNKLNRLQALLPVTLLAEHVRALQQILLKAPPNAIPPNANPEWPNTAAALRDLAEKLSEKYLTGQNYLPTSIPSLFKSAGPDIDGYKGFLADAGAKITLLDLVIKDGFAAVWKKIPPAPNAASLQAITVAYTALDGKIGEIPLPSPKDAAASILDTLNSLDRALAAANPAPAAPPPGAAHGVSIESRSYEQLVIQIRNLDIVTWLVFGGLATAAGVYVLIISNLGFGLPADFVACLFWGFGLPVGGQQLLQLTPGSVVTALGVTVPKAQ